MKLKNRKGYKALLLLVVMLLLIVVSITGCISGITPIGWSGGMVSDKTIYIGSRQGRLVALNLEDDSLRSAEKLKVVTQTGLFGCSLGLGGCGSGSSSVPIYGTPVVSGDLVYIAGYNGKIYAYNKDTLAVRWVFPRDSYLPSIVGGLVKGGGKLFFGTAGGTINGEKTKGRVYALDAVTGDPLWHFDAEDKIWATPVFYDNTVYDTSSDQTTNQDTLFIGSFDKKLYALNANDGSTWWECQTQGALIATPLLFNGKVYVGSMDRKLYAMNATDGKEEWHISGENWFWAKSAVCNGNIYAGCLDGKVYVVEADMGGKVTTLDLGEPIASSPVVVGDAVIFATKKGVIYSIDTVSNQATQLADIETEVNSPLTAWEDIVYINTHDDILYRINAVSGAVLPPIFLESQ